MARFRRLTDLIESLSLDEAYLDVTENKTGLPTATQVARTIRKQIGAELQLTASAERRAEQVPRTNTPMGTPRSARKKPNS